MSDKVITWLPMNMFVADILRAFGGLKGMDATKISKRGNIVTITLNSGSQIVVNPMDTISQESTGKLTVKRWDGFL